MNILVSPELKSQLSAEHLRIILNVFAQTANPKNTMIVPIPNGLRFLTNQSRTVNVYGISVSVPMILHVINEREGYLESTIEDLRHM